MEASDFLSVLFSIPCLGLLYAGPDQLLPLASVLGGVIGILLIFWQRVKAFIGRALSAMIQKVRPSNGK